MVFGNRYAVGDVYVWGCVLCFFVVENGVDEFFFVGWEYINVVVFVV